MITEDLTNIFTKINVPELDDKGTELLLVNSMEVKIFYYQSLKSFMIIKNKFC